MANNPLPFYGHKDAYWTRVISAPANVLSRLAALVDQYDGEFTGEKRLSLLKGVAGYLKIYYKGRAELPNDESNGNTPLVSAYEVAWYSWRVFDEMFRLTGENECREYRDLIRRLIEQEKVKNNVDLCYQTIAFVEIDRAAYADRIKRNAERVLSLQRDDGQWSMLFEKTARRSSSKPITASTRSPEPVTLPNIPRSRSRSGSCSSDSRNGADGSIRSRLMKISARRSARPSSP